MADKLPTWEELKDQNKYDSFDGEGEKVELELNRCSHKQVKPISGNEARCTCGAGFQGPRINDLVNLLTHKS